MQKNLLLIFCSFAYIIFYTLNASAQIPSRDPQRKINPPYPKRNSSVENAGLFSATKRIDNPDSNMANWLLTAKLLNFYFDMGSESNIGLYAGVQMLFIEDKNKYGFEINYDHSFAISEGGINQLKNSFINIGGYKIIEAKEAIGNERIVVKEYFGGITADNRVIKVREILPWPVRVMKYRGVRGGLINEHILFQEIRYSTSGFYFGYTKQERSNNYTEVFNSNYGHYYLDFSKLNIFNFDVIYFPLISPDVRKTEDVGSAIKKSWPFGIRANAQMLYPIARKYQKGVRQRRIYGITTKFELGYKFIQGVYGNLTIGLQIVRR